jgi:hypothetical protein
MFRCPNVSTPSSPWLLLQVSELHMWAEAYGSGYIATWFKEVPNGLCKTGAPACARRSRNRQAWEQQDQSFRGWLWRALHGSGMTGRVCLGQWLRLCFLSCLQSYCFALLTGPSICPAGSIIEKVASLLSMPGSAVSAWSHMPIFDPIAFVAEASSGGPPFTMAMKTKVRAC